MLHVFQPFLVWEGPYIDMWSIAHTMAGVLAAYVLARFAVSRWRGFALVVLIAIVWEIFERIIGTGELEKYANSVMDVVVAAVGYLGGYEVFKSKLIAHDKNSLAFLAFAIFLVVCALRVLGA